MKKKRAKKSLHRPGQRHPSDLEGACYVCAHATLRYLQAVVKNGRGYDDAAVVSHAARLLVGKA